MLRSLSYRNSIFLFSKCRQTFELLKLLLGGGLFKLLVTYLYVSSTFYLKLEMVKGSNWYVDHFKVLLCHAFKFNCLISHLFPIRWRAVDAVGDIDIEVFAYRISLPLLPPRVLLNRKICLLDNLLLEFHWRYSEILKTNRLYCYWLSWLSWSSLLL